KGIKILDNPKDNLYPMPINSTDRDEVFIGRIRKDNSIDNGVNLWVVSDNLRKGAALNAVQISETLIDQNLLYEGVSIFIVIDIFVHISLKGINKVKHFLSDIYNCIDQNKKPVIVVSAIGRIGETYDTDTLIKDLENINKEIDPVKKNFIISCGETIA